MNKGNCEVDGYLPGVNKVYMDMRHFTCIRRVEYWDQTRPSRISPGSYDIDKSREVVMSICPST